MKRKYLSPISFVVALDFEGTLAESVVNMTTTVVTAQQDYANIGDCNVWNNDGTQREDGNVIWKD